jgi:hypothetical protein
MNLAFLLGKEEAGMHQNISLASVHIDSGLVCRVLV